MLTIGITPSLALRKVGCIAAIIGITISWNWTVICITKPHYAQCGNYTCSIQKKASWKSSCMLEYAVLTCDVTQVHCPIAIVKGERQFTEPRRSTVAIECTIICRPKKTTHRWSSCCTGRHACDHMSAKQRGWKMQAMKTSAEIVLWLT